MIKVDLEHSRQPAELCSGRSRWLHYWESKCPLCHQALSVCLLSTGLTMLVVTVSSRNCLVWRFLTYSQWHTHQNSKGGNYNEMCKQFFFSLCSPSPCHYFLDIQAYSLKTRILLTLQKIRYTSLKKLLFAFLRLSHLPITLYQWV